MPAKNRAGLTANFSVTTRATACRPTAAFAAAAGATEDLAHAKRISKAVDQLGCCDQVFLFLQMP